LARKKASEVENVDSDILSSEEEVQLALRFAQAYSQSLGIYPSAFNPQLLNSRMQEMTLRSPSSAVTSENAVRALENPKNSEKELLAMSEYFEITSSPYRRLLNYMADLLSWDLTYYCKESKNPKEKIDYTSKHYKDDLDIIKKFLFCFDIKKEFPQVMRQLYREDTFFSVLRDEGEDSYVLQQLPSDYSLITGRWDYGLLFSFDYSFFLRQGIDLDLFPPIFKETYRKLFTKNNVDSYDPSININLRGDSSWVYFCDCSPNDGFWAWKLNGEKTVRTPYFSGLFPDLANQNFIRNLQKNSFLNQAIKLLSGQVPMLNKETKATVKDAYAMSPEVLGKFLQLMRSAIAESVNVVAAPLDDIRGIEFEGNNDIQSSWTRNTLGSAGINANFLYSGGDYRMNQVETMISLDIDTLAAQEIYPFFNKFLEYYINKRTKYYKFGFSLEGSNIYLDRQRRLDTQITLMGQGIILPQRVSAAIGMNPFVFQAQLDEARANGWVDNLTPIIPAAQQSGAETKTGRPSKSDTELGDAGAETRSEGANISKLKSNK
jgi:hypothetical protein